MQQLWALVLLRIRPGTRQVFVCVMRPALNPGSCVNTTRLADTCFHATSFEPWFFLGYDQASDSCLYATNFEPGFFSGYDQVPDICLYATSFEPEFFSGFDQVPDTTRYQIFVFMRPLAPVRANVRTAGSTHWIFLRFLYAGTYSRINLPYSFLECIICPVPNEAWAIWKKNC